MASDDTSNNTTVQIWPSFQLNVKSPPVGGQVPHTFINLAPPAPHSSSSPVSPGYHAPVSTIFIFLSTAMCSSFLPVRFLCSNLLSTPFKMHYTKHHYFSTTFLLLHLLHCGCSITKMEGHVGLHTPMQPQLRAYPYAYTLLPLYYISTSLSHWLSWPLGSNRLWASVARTFKVGDWESPWLFWTLPDHPHARIQLFRRLDGADRI